MANLKTTRPCVQSLGKFCLFVCMGLMPLLNLFPKQSLVFTCLQCKSLENTVGKGETACNEQFLLFQKSCLFVWRTFCYFHQIQNYCLQTLSVQKSLKFVVWEIFNDFKPSTLYQTILTFNNLEKESL